jgi:hypothetical protein
MSLVIASCIFDASSPFYYTLTAIVQVFNNFLLD